MERAGLATVQVCTMTPVAQMVGSNRIVAGNGIVHPLGDADRSPEEERRLRRKLLERGLAALATPVERPTIFF